MTVGIERRLWELAQGQRWFPESFSRHDLLTAELGPWVSPVLRAGYLLFKDAAGMNHRFFIPLSYRQQGEPRDACDDGQVLLDALREQAPGFTARRQVPGPLPARRYRGEQSNTSVFYGDQLLVKVFRALEPGLNIDVELHEALAGCGVVAELYGTWREQDTDLAVFLEALPDPHDGYRLACQAASENLNWSDQAAALGQALATVHTLLAQRLATATSSAEAVAQQASERFSEVASHHPQLERFSVAAKNFFSDISATEVSVQRIHGDCHLGQVLATQGRWVYVDFEGEPLKSLAERRTLDSPLRDVAGMLRSFDYAAATGKAGPQWRVEVRNAFASGYGIDLSHPLLACYELDKAAYEVHYEARYRPHLINIPLRAIDELLR